MSGKLRWLGLAGLTGLLVVIAAGCDVRGGGTIALKGPGNPTATFSINVKHQPDGGHLGTAEYHDVKAGVHVRANVTFVARLPKTNIDLIKGQYAPQPGVKGPGGTFTMTIADQGQAGPSQGDPISLSLEGGVFNGYKREGVLKGGHVLTTP